jgi:hypothetical protein
LQSAWAFAEYKEVADHEPKIVLLEIFPIHSNFAEAASDDSHKKKAEASA